MKQSYEEGADLTPKNCRVCGAKAEVVFFDKQICEDCRRGIQRMCYVACTNEMCVAHDWTEEYETKNEAIRAWNRGKQNEF